MFPKLVSHNDDLRRLVEKRFAVGFDGNYLIVRDIPYLDEARNACLGAFVAKIEFRDGTSDKVFAPDHTLFFAGGVPHGLDGKPIPNLGGGPATLALSPSIKDIVVQRSFSHKLKPGGTFRPYHDFFEKIETYVTVVAGPAIEMHGVSPYTSRIVESEIEDSVFKIHDTLTSLAEITDLVSSFKQEVVAIIGLGGTGAFVLDFLAKTPVREIRGFDPDTYYIHNGFRAPGGIEPGDFGKLKADVCNARYEKLRRGVKIVPKFIDANSTDELKGATFAFVCVDKGSSRAGVFNVLSSLKIPFIDVGMGLRRKGALTGMIRTTLFSVERGDEIAKMGLAELSDTPDDLYRTSIQIGELNALNAALAVIRYKQLRGFYAEEIPYYHLLFGISDLKTAGDA